MRLDVRALTNAGAVVAAVIFVVCALFVALAPEAAMSFAGFLLHADLSGLARDRVTWGNFFGGLASFSALFAVVYGASGWVYNRLARK